MNKFSTEIYLEFFSYIERKNDLYNCINVSRTWFNIGIFSLWKNPFSRNPCTKEQKISLQQTLTNFLSPKTNNHLRPYIKYIKELKTEKLFLILDKNIELTEEILNYILENSKIKYISFSDERIKNIIQKKYSLQNFYLNTSYGDLVKGFENISGLLLHGSHNSNYKILSTRKFQNLTNLRLRNFYIHRRRREGLIKKIAEFENLKYLSLIDTDFNDVENVYEKIKKVKLKYLKICTHKLKTKYNSKFIETLKKNNIKIIKIGRSEFGLLYHKENNIELINKF